MSAPVQLADAADEGELTSIKSLELGKNPQKVHSLRSHGTPKSSELVKGEHSIPPSVSPTDLLEGEEEEEEENSSEAEEEEKRDAFDVMPGLMSVNPQISRSGALATAP